jgi:hypothetical protein
MRKIVSLFARNYDGDRLVRDEVVPGAEWVIEGEGIATRKYDGTCCMVRDGRLFKRHDVKRGREKPEGFIPAQDPDPVTGHWPGWVPVGEGPMDRWHREAWQYHVGQHNGISYGGTYELCGPKIGSNPVNAEGFEHHVLIPHGIDRIDDAPRTFDGLKAYLADGAIEGIVWHHPDGRMVKIKGKDFGIRRAAK